MLLSLIRMIQAFRDYQRNVAELSQLAIAELGQFIVSPPAIRRTRLAA
ncbi:MAG: hypothetical protein JSV48_07310 [Bradyrhizobium sp.]|nr:MAG: hypothetical protein JSV48_07310 [Bradyrhizobium sp.]